MSDRRGEDPAEINEPGGHPPKEDLPANDPFDPPVDEPPVVDPDGPTPDVPLTLPSSSNPAVQG